MRRKALAACLLAGLLVISARAHDLFLKLDTYFLSPNSRATVRLLNGTFRASDGVVARDRMRDVSLVTPGGVTRPPDGNFRDDGKTTLLDLETSGAGTYVVGLSTKPREIDLKAKDFNEYLSHDGIPDTLAARKKSGELGKDVRERYSKHVRAVFQVGDKLTDDYKKPLSYPVEIIPQQNPYSLRVGRTIEVLCTLDGQPIANQFVMAGWESKRGRLRSLSTRTDARGIARFRLRGAGKWYVKFIHMTKLDDPQINYESKWATLTFEVK
jgi:uncharacterized GH25 family protein